MNQHSRLNVKSSNSQLNKLKSAIKNATEVTLNLSSNIVGDSDNKSNFPHKLLLTNTQFSKLFQMVYQLKQVNQENFLSRLLRTITKN